MTSQSGIAMANWVRNDKTYIGSMNAQGSEVLDAVAFSEQTTVKIRGGQCF